MRRITAPTDLRELPTDDSIGNKTPAFPDHVIREAVRNFHNGYDPNLICSGLNINRFTLNNWIKKLAEPPPPFKAPMFNLEQQEALKGLIQEPSKPEEPPPIERVNMRGNKKGIKYRKFSDDTKIEAVLRFKAGESAYKLGQEYGVVANQIRRWAHILEPDNRPPPPIVIEPIAPTPPTPTPEPITEETKDMTRIQKLKKWPKELKAEIAKRYHLGESPSALAKELGCRTNYVYKWAQEHPMTATQKRAAKAPWPEAKEEASFVPKAKPTAPSSGVSFTFEDEEFVIRIPKNQVTRTLLAGLL